MKKICRSKLILISLREDHTVEKDWEQVLLGYVNALNVAMNIRKHGPYHVEIPNVPCVKHHYVDLTIK